MAHNQDAQVIDALEEQLLRYGISFDRLRRHLAKFSLELIFKGKLGTISAENLHSITLALSEAISRECIDREDTCLKNIIALLCAIEAKCETPSSETYIMAKCSLFCFGTLEGWVEEDSGDSTPIYLYFIMLKKIFPDVRQDFVRFFQELLYEKN
nr:hypothetical protein [uncultured Pseudomonas sp.]